eukprot:3932549-Rhodomonas_salina.2
MAWSKSLRCCSFHMTTRSNARARCPMTRWCIQRRVPPLADVDVAHPGDVHLAHERRRVCETYSDQGGVGVLPPAEQAVQ